MPCITVQCGGRQAVGRRQASATVLMESAASGCAAALSGTMYEFMEPMQRLAIRPWDRTMSCARMPIPRLEQVSAYKRAHGHHGGTS